MKERGNIRAFCAFQFRKPIFAVEDYNLGITQLLQENFQQKERGNI
jgi:hypothetical protein